MTGPKLNEASMVAGERSGTKASAKYLRVVGLQGPRGART